MKTLVTVLLLSFVSLASATQPTPTGNNTNVDATSYAKNTTDVDVSSKNTNTIDNASSSYAVNKSDIDVVAKGGNAAALAGALSGSISKGGNGYGGAGGSISGLNTGSTNSVGLNINNPRQPYNNPNSALYGYGASASYNCKPSAGASGAGGGMGGSVFFPWGGEVCEMMYMIDKLQAMALRYGDLEAELVMCRAQEASSDAMYDARNDEDQEGGKYTCFMEYQAHKKTVAAIDKQIDEASRAVELETAKARIEQHFDLLDYERDRLIRTAPRPQ